MNREELFASIVAAGPGRDDLVYLERTGDAYGWRLLTTDSAPSPAAGTPDVWMLLSVAWPLDEPERLPAFFDDLLGELESMADNADRCRWPLDEPWPHGH